MSAARELAMWWNVKQAGPVGTRPVARSASRYRVPRSGSSDELEFRTEGAGHGTGHRPGRSGSRPAQDLAWSWYGGAVVRVATFRGVVGCAVNTWFSRIVGLVSHTA